MSAAPDASTNSTANASVPATACARSRVEAAADGCTTVGSASMRDMTSAVKSIGAEMRRAGAGLLTRRSHSSVESAPAYEDGLVRRLAFTRQKLSARESQRAPAQFL